MVKGVGSILCKLMFPTSDLCPYHVLSNIDKTKFNSVQLVVDWGGV